MQGKMVVRKFGDGLVIEGGLDIQFITCGGDSIPVPQVVDNYVRRAFVRIIEEEFDGEETKYDDIISFGKVRITIERLD
jgi:hypothetical protein